MQVLHDVVMSDHLWYQIGGKVRYLLLASSIADVTEALEFIQENKIEKFFVCGLGANLIFTDEYYDGAVIQILSGQNKLYEQVSLSRDFSHDQIMKEGQILTVFGGEILDNVIVYSLQQGLIGMEWAGGLPGTIGAGIRGNVGAFGGEIKDTFLEADVLTYSQNEYSMGKMTNSDMGFGYRRSAIKKNKNQIILSASFQLYPAVGAQLETSKQTYFANIMYRKTRHPLDYPNCGSVFKNISDRNDVKKVLSVWPDIQEKVDTIWHGKVSMGYIIKRLELSGKRIGDAEISEKHSNFILNKGEAKAKDVISLIHEIKMKTDETFGFTPEVEVEIVE